jgi:membrane-associated HD superfamily phosphohydrolase
MNFDLELKKKKSHPEAAEKRRSSLGKLLIGIAFITVISYISFQPPLKTVTDSSLKIGDIAAEDIIIRKDMTVEDKEMTEANRQKALDGLIPVYEFSEQKIASTQMLLNEWFKYFKAVRKEWAKGRVKPEHVRSQNSGNFGLRRGHR